MFDSMISDYIVFMLNFYQGYYYITILKNRHICIELSINLSIICLYITKKQISKFKFLKWMHSWYIFRYQYRSFSIIFEYVDNYSLLIFCISPESVVTFIFVSRALFLFCFVFYIRDVDLVNSFKFQL